MSRETHTTHGKRTPEAKATTQRRKQARAAKYATPRTRGDR